MLKQLKVPLTEDEIEALGKLARKERRRLEPQAAVIIRDDLIRRGLLQPDEEQAEKAGPRNEPTPV